jgi:hypothetical protein
MGNLDCNMGDANDACNVGIQYLGGNNVGTKILKNKFYDNYLGIYIKHANADTSETGAEIAYNYMYDNTHGMYGVPVYVNYHDNLLVGCDFMFGDNGGGISGHYSTINHNTVYGTGKGIYLISQGSDVSGDTGAIHGMTITNNIFTAKTTESYAAGNTQTLQTSWDYNMYGDDAAIGAHDLGMTTPTFSGGSTYPNYYVLTAESAGYQDGSDGADLGADVSQVYGYSGSDTIAPTVSSVNSDKANGTYTVGEVIDIDVTFSEAVTSTGNVTMTCETGDTDRTCTFTVTNGTTGTCNYTVQAGDTSADLNCVVSGTIADQSSNAMSVFTATTTLAANKAIVIDTMAPVVSEFTIPATSGTRLVTISSFTCTGSPTGYIMNESAEAPAASAEGWTGTAPTSYTFGSDGEKTLYGYCKDLAGNVSTGVSDTVTVTTSAIIKAPFVIQ